MRRSNIFRITGAPTLLERGSCGGRSNRSNHRFSQRNYPGRTIFSGRTRRSNSIGGRLHGFNLTVKRN
jgi:hypothetical protein